ncbi:MAG: MFS transporter, partial [Anaeromyxobacteraceae bacterium]|nr:MFS transporter [Anaeromyxobacteraceae bacterium]
APGGWRTPAVVLGAGAALLAVSLGVRHAFGLFLAPMSRDLGWTREVFAFAIALQNLVWGVAQPFAGRLSDRLGAGRVIVAGSLLYVAGLALMAGARSAVGLAVSAGLLIGLGLSGTTMTVVFGAIARAVPPERRSMAMGVAMSVGSLGQFVMLPAASGAIGAVGWPTTLLAMAALGVAMAPLAAALGEAPGAGQARAAPRPLGAVLGEALAHRGFWLLSFGFFVCGFHVVFIATHLPAFLADRGLPASTGAVVLALVGLFNIAGSYLAGWLGGRHSKPGLLVGLYLARAVVIAAFVLVPVSEGSAWAFGAAMGLLWLSTVPLTNGTVAAVFGVGDFALLGGIVFFFHQVGAFLGGWLGGRLYVLTGSYDVVWWLSVGLALLAALLNAPVRETPVARLRPAEGRST